MNYTDEIISFIQNYDDGSMWDEFVVAFEDVDDEDLDSSDIIEWMQNYPELYDAFLTADDTIDERPAASKQISLEDVCKKLHMPIVPQETMWGDIATGLWIPENATTVEEAAKEFYNALSSRGITAEVEYWFEHRPYKLGNKNNDISLQLTQERDNTYTVRDISNQR